MTKIKQTKNDLLNLLQENCDSLTTSCRAFDEGLHSEAKRLAVTLRVLLHDTQNSRSLLSQLKARQNMRHYSTHIPRLKNNLLHGHHSLAGVIYDRNINAVTFYPLINKCPKPKSLNFEDWWNSEMVLSTDHDRHLFNRREIILLLANKDGGAHVDPKLPIEYAKLSRTLGMGLFIEKGSTTKVYREVAYKKLPQNTPEIQNTDTPVLGVELHTIRQIAHEALISIKKKFPDIRLHKTFIQHPKM